LFATDITEKAARGPTILTNATSLMTYGSVSKENEIPNFVEKKCDVTSNIGPVRLLMTMTVVVVDLASLLRRDFLHHL
jgi:hypothetical protein